MKIRYIINKSFEEKEGGLLIEEFVEVMLEHLDYKKNDEDEKLKITIALIDLFKEIDVNGDGNI